MIDTTPQHGVAYVAPLIESLQAQGYSTAQILSGSGLRSVDLTDDRTSVAFGSIAALFENAAALTGNDLVGFEMGQQREEKLSGLICYVGLASPTVMDFFRNIARFRRVFSDAVEIDVTALESAGRLTWGFTVPTRISRRQYVEFGAAGTLKSIREHSGFRIVPRLVTFRHARNRNIRAFETYFGCEVRFGQPANSFVFDPADLALPLRTADNHLYKVLRQCCEDAIKSKASAGSSLIVEVERIIVNGLSAGDVTQAQVARDLGLSPRTLARKLAREETTFFRTLEDLRKSLAMNYLRDSDLSLAEIAFLLGFARLSSFSEAFRRWTDQTPGQFRATDPVGRRRVG